MMAPVEPALSRLAEQYPNPETELVHTNPWQLLVATMLSAQCTDRRVNMITPRLFRRFPDAFALAEASLADVEELIRDCGLYHTKAQNLIRTARVIAETYRGEVPADRDALMALPGVGRKTANVVLSNAFGVDALAVDTHVFRVSHRLGWSNAKDPAGTEQQLMALIPQALWSKAHHWLIYHGRYCCKAVRPLCHECPLADLCPSAERRDTHVAPVGG